MITSLPTYTITITTRHDGRFDMQMSERTHGVVHMSTIYTSFSAACVAAAETGVLAATRLGPVAAFSNRRWKLRP